MDLSKFTYKTVKLPISAPRPGNQLIGFDKSFCANRVQDYVLYFDINQELLNNYPDVIFDNDSCYIASLNLTIDFRFKKEHNFSAFNNKDKFHQHCLNGLLDANDMVTIKQWCVLDVERRESFKNKKYLELFEVFDISDLLTQIRRACFGLEYIYSDEQIIKEIKSIGQGDFGKNSQTNKTVLTYQPSFYQRENELYINDHFWRRKLIDNCKAFLYKKEYELQDKEILRQIKIAGLHNGFSHHSPYWIKAFIEKYQITSCADPCSGWGQRLIGAKDIRYFSNDIDPDIINGQKKIQQLLGSNVVFSCQDAAEYAPIENYQSVFTCPPYFDTEIFFTKNTSTELYPTVDDWLNVWWRKVVQKWNKPSVEVFAFIINNE